MGNSSLSFLNKTGIRLYTHASLLPNWPGKIDDSTHVMTDDSAMEPRYVWFLLEFPPRRIKPQCITSDTVRCQTQIAETVSLDVRFYVRLRLLMCVCSSLQTWNLCRVRVCLSSPCNKTSLSLSLFFTEAFPTEPLWLMTTQGLMKARKSNGRMVAEFKLKDDVSPSPRPYFTNVWPAVTH